MRALVPILSGSDSKIITDSKIPIIQCRQVYDNNMVTAGIDLPPILVLILATQYVSGALSGKGLIALIQDSRKTPCTR